MSKTDPASGRGDHASQRSFLERFPWEKITIWGLFLLLVYVLRSFFTTIFLTFIFSYMMTNLVRWAHGVLSPGRERLWLHRLLTASAFLLLIGSLYGIFAFLEKPFREQINKVALTIRSVDLRKIGNDLIRETVGAMEYGRLYSGAAGENRLAEELEEFRRERFSEAAVEDFEEQWRVLERDFKNWFRSEYGPIRRDELERTGELSHYVRSWLRDYKARQIYENNAAEWNDRWETSYAQLNGRTAEQKLSALPPLEELQKDPQRFRDLREQWILGRIVEEQLSQRAEDAADPEFLDYLADRYYAELQGTEQLREALRTYYEDEQITKPIDAPNYEFDKLIALRDNRDDPEMFNRILLEPLEEADQEETVEKTFERTRKAKLGQEALKDWNFDVESLNRKVTEEWIPFLTGNVARGGVYVFQFVVQFALSLLLSFFITWDLSRMKRGIEALRHSRASNFFNEIAPSLAAFGALIGRAFQAQGLIAVCNTVLTFALIEGLQIPFEIFLCTIVFLCSFIPVLGVVLSTVPIALIALLYSGLDIALFAVGGVLLIHFIETSVLNPKILGEMLHLHPVLVLCILVVGERFFHVWGLLLGVPVMVYIIRYVIMGEDVRSITRPPVAFIRRRRGSRSGDAGGGGEGDDPKPGKLQEKPVGVSSSD